jgi:hypothetical protein
MLFSASARAPVGVLPWTTGEPSSARPRLILDRMFIATTP